ncbi:MAG: Crp/Fnr family transcriptional regulator [Flavitalea sp.]
MSEELINHIRKFVPLNDSEAKDISGYFELVRAKKKTNLLKENSPCRSLYFVAKGCLRLYFVKENGNEQTTQFALENWWLTDYTAFQLKKNATHSVQAIENSELLSISSQQFDLLLSNHSSLEKYFRLIFMRGTSAAQTRMRIMYDFSREEMYHQFVSNFPGFVQRIPQYMLASYLGVTPEYLSEIRKRSIK